MNKLLIVLGVGCLSAMGFGQLTSVSQFSGSLNDDFESYANYNSGALASLAVMGGGATFSGSGTQMYIYDPALASWGLGGYGAATVSSGVQGLGLFNGGNGIDVVLTFTNEVSRFGAKMADVQPANSTMTFFDANNVQIGATQIMDHGSGSMDWKGWSSTVGIKSIVFGGGGVAPVMDDIQADAVPEPASLAVLGLGVAVLLRRRRK